MKKTIYLIVVIILVCGMLAGCTKTNNDYTIVAPDGAPSLALAGLISDNKVGEYNITATIVPNNEIGTQAIKSDLAIVPSNMAIKLSNSDNNYKMLGVVTNGNLFVLSNKTNSNNDNVSLESLKGSLLLCIGMGSSPDYVFQAILKNKGIEYKVVDDNTTQDNIVSIRYFASGAEVVSTLKLLKNQGLQAYGMIAEPLVTKAIADEDFSQVFDVQELWQDMTGGEITGFPQSILICNQKIANNKDFVDKLIARIQGDIQVVQSDPNRAIQTIKDSYISSTLPAQMTDKIFQRNNIRLISLENNTSYVDDFAKQLHNINTNSIGGILPTEQSYYKSK